MNPLRHPELRARFDAAGRIVLRGPSDHAPLAASREALDLLALCDGARTPDELASALLEQGSLRAASPALATKLVLALLAPLRDAGLVLDAGMPERQEDGYARPWVHRLMLQDEPRTVAFRRAIEALVRPGDVVLDVGTGTGILAVFAARAGAAEVHGVERSGLAQTAAEVARASGQGEVVRMHAGDARSVEIQGADGEPLRARVLVSEWIGHFAVTEGMFPSVATIRDRYLVPGGVIIPSRVELLVAPVEDVALRRQGPGYWFERPWDIDLSVVGRMELSRPTTLIDKVAPESPLSAPASVHVIDCLRDGPSAVMFDSEVEVTILRDGSLDGLAGWFTADLAPGIVLDTSPSAPLTHWRQHLFPIKPIAVKRGDKLVIRLSVNDASMSGGTPTFQLEMILGDRTIVDSSYAAD